MQNQAIKSTDQGDIVSSLIIHGDLSRLNPQQKIEYYQGFCERLGLDPFCQPFQIIRFRDGREQLYCTRAGAQQLNRLFKVSHRITARENINGAYVVTAQASTADRRTESIGAVYVEGLKGDQFCNALMKAETKAKRRSTLDLLGLGVLDETETGSVDGAATIAIETPKKPAEVIAPKSDSRSIPFELMAEVIDLLDHGAFSPEEVEQANIFLKNASEAGVIKMIERLKALIAERAHKEELIEEDLKDIPY